LELADEKGARFTIIIGSRDMEKNEVSIRNMSDKSTAQIKFDEVDTYLEKLIK
jgi:histidyl-tRNA synthetase